jgi:ribonuclease E
MLIDAAHAEETRVVVVDGHRIEELDFEHQSRKQLRGNIYLAKVTRVEPSLQAAFVEYGGNRHGFLAFNEIHPDYYQIPIADREALMREEAEAEAEDHHHHSERGGRGAKAAADHDGEDGEDGDETEANGVIDDDDDVIEEQLERRRRRLMRRYKIQEVIKRRQIMLVQVVKEERGNKGAALTSYLSLAGRYCVLMPNTARGGGISRKITQATDRKRLKSAAQSLDVPHGMGLIIRTAGAARTKAEIKRDYEYLLRLWETIREATLKSIAPALIYEEEDLVKRAIRDMFDKDVEGVWVEGEAGYREARDFMRMIMPSQAKKIQLYKEPMPLFVKHGVEDQLAQIHSPNVPLRSGGYLVINQTEALVAIDVNSGKATRERNIEATALKTNMEAAEESARQLRLRDLAGLVVIDFIDMDESKNNRAVEKKLKDCLKDDRARVQMGKISSFGLMEISRQRRRLGVLEGATHVCEHCQGQGRIRSVESSALGALRAIEIESAKGGPGAITVRMSTAVGLYVLNEKRAYLTRLEQAQGLTVTIVTDEKLAPAEYEIVRTATHEGRPRQVEDYAPQPEAFIEAVEDIVDEDEDEEEDDDEAEASDGGRRPRAETESGTGSRNGKRRRRRRGRRDEGDRPPGDRSPRPLEAGAATGEDDSEEDEDEPRRVGETAAESSSRRRRRRGRRGGRRMREDGPAVAADPFSWVHPHAGTDEPIHDEDPYVWRDPHSQRLRTITPPQRRSDPARIPAAAAAAPAPSTPSRPDPYAWTAPTESMPAPEPVIEAAPAPTAPVEAEAVAEAKPKRSRASRKAPAGAPTGRSRGKAAPPADEPAAPDMPAPAPAIEPVAAAPEPAPPPARAPRAVKAVAPPAPAPEPVPPAPEPAVVAAPVREPDPAEISTPPAAPRRGWWRR